MPEQHTNPKPWFDTKIKESRFLVSLVLTLVFLSLVITTQAQQWIQDPATFSLADTSGFYFSIGDTGYISTTNLFLPGHFWQFNPISGNWTSKQMFSDTLRSDAVGFSVGGKGYVVTGANRVKTGYSSYSQQPPANVQQYEPAADRWIAKSAFPGTPRMKAFGFVINDKAYVGGGIDWEGKYLSDCWEYTPLTDQWLAIAPIPVARCAAVSFSISGIGYVSTGLSDAGVLQDLWSYDPVRNIWLQKNDYIGSPRQGASAFVINGFGYVLDGSDSAGTGKNDVYSYNPLTDSWTPQGFFDEPGQFGITFTLHDTGYFGLNGIYDGNGYNGGIYAFKPCASYMSPAPLILPDGVISLCNGSSIVLTSSSLSDNQWSLNGTLIPGETGSQLHASQAGQYRVYVADKTGCVQASSPDTLSLFVGNKIFSHNDTTGCGNVPLILDAKNKGASFLWSDGSTDEYLKVTQSGRYWVRTGTAGGCLNSDTIQCVLIPAPSADLPADTSGCSGNTILLSPKSGLSSFHWSTGFAGNALPVTTSGTYWVTVSENGCTASDTTRVGFNPVPVVSLGKDTSLCMGDSLPLSAGEDPSLSYLWQDGHTLSMDTIRQSGSASVRVTNTYGCTTGDTIRVTFTPPPRLTLVARQSYCQGDSAVLDAGNPGSSYLWSTGSTQSKIIVRSTGLYHVTVTSRGCSAEDSSNLFFKPSPQIRLGNDTSMCLGDSLTLNAFTPNSSYTWQDHSSQPVYTVHHPGTYSVNVDENGCETTGAILVNYISKPQTNLRDSLLCAGDKLVLNAFSPASAYQWQDGSNAAEYSVTKPGTYTVQIRNRCGLIADTIRITYGECSCEVRLPSAFSPNSDGLNDVFMPVSECSFGRYSFSVYNRWGTPVFTTRDAGKGWNGIINNYQADAGTYIWMISYEDTRTGRTVQRTGTVTLIR